MSRIAEVDREVESLMAREGFAKHGASFSGPTNREKLELQRHLNEAVLPQLKLAGIAYAEIQQHHKA